MSKMRIVMFALAAGSAAMAAILAKGFVNKEPAVTTEVINQVKTTDVLVAAKDILVGEKLMAGTIIWKAWPSENVLDSMITREEKADADQSLAEFRALVPMFEGETINEKKMVDPKGGGFMSSVLPKGMRAVAVQISDYSSAGGFILPNDRVDVIITREIPQTGTGGKLAKSETVISNVRVLAVNQIFSKAAKEGEENAIKGETATLEMSIAQAEVVARVGKEGELSLALRSIAESEGKAMQEGPMLAEKYRGGDGTKKRSNDTLFVRSGIETYAAGN
jgi:pilus assembly protein CpaB